MEPMVTGTAPSLCLRMACQFRIVLNKSRSAGDTSFFNCKPEYLSSSLSSKQREIRQFVLETMPGSLQGRWGGWSYVQRRLETSWCTLYTVTTASFAKQLIAAFIAVLVLKINRGDADTGPTKLLQLLKK